MPLFTTLLDRARANAAGIYVPGIDPASIVARRPAVDRAWSAWRDAHVELVNKQFGEASEWLRQAEESLVTLPDGLCQAEVDAAWMDLYDELDEPRQALAYARKAWTEWFALASEGQTKEWMPSVRSLLRALATDAKALPTDDELLFEWMLDRLAMQMLHVFKCAVRLYGTLRMADGAESLVSEMQQWMATYMSKVPLQLRVVSQADVLEDVGNLYDRLGDLRKSFDAFMQASELLGKAIDHPQVADLRLRVRFNAANELARMKEHGRAAAMFDELRQEFLRLGRHEPALRAQHASLVGRSYVGKVDAQALLHELDELIVAYEAQPSDVAATDLRQNLDQAYRLWLTLAAPRIAGNELLTHRFLGQLYALREGLTQFVTDWPKDSAAAPRVILSEVAVLAARLARHDGTVVLVVESGVDCIVLTTVRGGAGQMVERVRAVVTPREFPAALEDLLREYGQATDDIIDRTMSIRSPTGARFVTACRNAWTSVPAEIRDELSRASRLIVSLSNRGNLDEVPVELLHDGLDHIGLSKEIIRAVSLSQLSASLSDNLVNVTRAGSALVVRAADLEIATPLSRANPEVVQVEGSLRALGVEPRTLQAPSAGEFLEALGEGHDVFHYVGHGFADDNGEVLLLGSRHGVSAVNLMSLQPAPAPVCVASSCLVGRARHLRTGFQRGIVVALLSRGAPAVVAATEEVPDQLGEQFAAVFYRHAARGPLSAAMLATRRSLAEQRYHAAAWASFAMFGDPRATLLRKPQAPGWPALLLRLAATDSPWYAERARAAVGADRSVSATDAARVSALIAAFAGKTVSFFTPAKRKEQQGLEHDAEGYLAYRMLLLVGEARFSQESAGNRDEAAARVLAFWQKIDRMLNDSYLGLAVAVVGLNDLRTYTTSEGQQLMTAAAAAFHWLSADAELSATRNMLKEEVVI